ncbi:MAG: elongation factor G [Candidatus Kapaibacteriota bacterium]
MKVYEANDIRNIAFIGNPGSGKTNLTESLLFQAGVINRKGTVEDGNTVSDFIEIEHEKGYSIYATPVYLEWKDKKINIIDAPGLDDFVGETYNALFAADVAIITLSAVNGIEFGTDISVVRTKELNKPFAFFVNKMDGDQVNFEKLLADMKDAYGVKVAPIQYPLNHGAGFNQIIDLFKMKLLQFSADGKYTETDIPASEKSKADELRNQLVESIAESDEELLNKYFEQGDLEQEELIAGFKKAFMNLDVYPVFCGSAKLNIGISSFLDFIASNFPSASDFVYKTLDGKEIKVDSKSPTSLFIWKMYSDVKLGDLTYFKVITGSIGSGVELINHKRSSTERFGQVYSVRGKNREELPSLSAGDIGATVKLKNTHLSDTFHEKSFEVEYPNLVYPKQKIRVAVVPKTKGEEEKVGTSLHQIALEDASLLVEHSQELRQTLLFAQGDQQLQLVKWRLSNRFKVDAEFIDPRVPYRETITKSARASYRHKKQSGGAGQFAEVHMMIEPYVEGTPAPTDITVRGRDLQTLPWGGNLEYVNCIVGGVIDARFMPAILKGVMEKMEFGPLTGSFVRDIRIYVYDGKMHPVDSNEAAFKTAGRNAFKEAFINAAPKILEPIYDVNIIVPEQYVGDIMSDLPTRRGVILGIDVDGKVQIVKARMPLAELDKYYSALKSITQARGTFTYEFSEYQQVPPNVQQELMDAYKKQAEEEE